METTSRFVVAVLLSRQSLKLEVAWGAAFSIISGVTFAPLWSHHAPVLKEHKLALRTWSGECPDIMGSVMIDVSFQNNRAQLLLLVAGGVGGSLLRRNWLKKTGNYDACAQQSHRQEEPLRTP